MTDHGLLLDVWREIGRHTDLEEGLRTLGPTLIQALDASALCVRRLDVARRSLETVASYLAPGDTAPFRGRSEFGPEAFRELVDWCAHPGRAEHLSFEWSGADHPRRVALGGPLFAEGEPAGILVAVLSTDRHDSPARADRVRELLEPFGAALATDRRLRELSALREAADAERRSLLSRLGRDGVSDTVVGADGGLLGVMERVDLVARADLPVLLLGETGSGKEVVARAIHHRSGPPRSEGPFHRVNCGAIPPELIDSELFGHERGSFTGAVAQRRGWFERADGGTLFLDEIGELPPAAQVRLLRVLQDGRFERVGGEKPVHVDVRIVAATHRDLHAMVGAGRFREDLWYRIATFPVRIPALRERPEDIPELAVHFALRAARRFGTPSLTPDPDDLRQLCAYDWPGNVRELASVVDRAVILGEGRRLEVAKALGIGARPAPAAPAAIEPKPAPAPPSDTGRFPTLDEAMARHIESALSRTRGRIEGPRGAAAMLGINPHTLRARMRKLGVAWSSFRGETP